MLCKNCYIPMTGVLSFSREKRERFYRCSKCKGETKHMQLRSDELIFGEILHKAHKKYSNKKS